MEYKLLITTAKYVDTAGYNNTCPDINAIAKPNKILTPKAIFTKLSKLIDKNKIDKIIQINDDDAINMSRKISKQLGIGVGISSGANLIGSVLLANEINDNVVTVFADDNKKYLTTDLSKDIDTNNKFISNKIELLSYEKQC